MIDLSLVQFLNVPIHLLLLSSLVYACILRWHVVGY